MSVESARMSAAQAAIRAGKKQQARDLLHEELERNPDNFRAWLWLGGLAGSAQASLEYVRKAQQLNPDDVGVRKALDWAQTRLERENAKEQGALTAAPQENESDEAQAAALRVDNLREQKRQTEDRPRSRRRLALVALLLILVVTAVVAGAYWRDTAARPAAQPTAPEALGATTEEVTPTPGQDAIQNVDEPGPEAEQIAVNFVRGQFAPGADAAPAGNDPTPSPTATRPHLDAKPINKTDNEPRATWTLTPSPTFTPTATPTPVPTFVSEEVVLGGATRPEGVGPNERWIDVNLTTQRLVAYEGDRAVFDSLVSSGTWMHPTVTGQFRVWLRYTSQTMDGRRLGYDYYLPNVPYVMYFYRDYALHGTYWHNNFGTPMSHGCVNLPTPAAEWIFNWSSIGTLVNVHH